MALLIPPLNTKGFFQLKAPWAMPANTVYECIALREFQDFINIGEDVYSLVYQPRGLTRTDYENDRQAGAKIITLSAASHAKIFVPNTYLLGYPTMDNVAYSHVVLSISLGPVADAVDLTFLQDQLQGVVSTVIGVTTSTVKINAAPSDNYVTAVQHAQIEAARQNAIANRTTDLAKLLTANATIDELRQVNATYLQVIKDLGGLPPE